MVTLTQHFERLDSQQRLLQQSSSRGRRRPRRSSHAGKKGTFTGRDSDSICSAPAGFSNIGMGGGVGCGGGSSRGIRKRRTSTSWMAKKSLEEEFTLAGLVSESTNTTAPLTIASNHGNDDNDGRYPLHHSYYHSEVKDDDDDDEDDYSVTSAYTTVSCGFRPEGSISLLVDIGEDELTPLDLSHTNNQKQANDNNTGNSRSASSDQARSKAIDNRCANRANACVDEQQEEGEEETTQQQTNGNQSLSGWMQASFSNFFQEAVEEVNKTVQEESKGGWDTFLQNRMDTFKTNIQTLAINAAVTTTTDCPSSPSQSLPNANCNDMKKEEEAGLSLEEQLLADDGGHSNLMGCDVLVEAVATNVDHCQAIAENYVRNVETLMLTAMGKSSFELPAITQG